MNDQTLMADQPQETEPQNYLEELVGEGKRYKDIDALARSKWEGDRYIKFLEGEKDKLTEDYMGLRDKYNARATLEELLNKTQQQTNSDNTRDANVMNQPTINPDEIKSLVSNTVQEIETTKRQQENFNSVRNKLIERFGNNYQSSLKEQADSLGLTINEVDELARTKPKVLMRTLGLDQEPQRQTFQAPPQNQFRQASFSPAVKKRDHSYYENLRNSDPNSYWDSKTQVQMHRDITEQGPDAFYNDPDWLLKT